MLSNDVTVKIIFPSEVGKLIVALSFAVRALRLNKHVCQVRVVKRKE